MGTRAAEELPRDRWLGSFLLLYVFFANAGVLGFSALQSWDRYNKIGRNLLKLPGGDFHGALVAIAAATLFKTLATFFAPLAAVLAVCAMVRLYQGKWPDQAAAHWWTMLLSFGCLYWTLR